VSENQTLAPNPRKKEKQMATKENAPKVEKAVVLDSAIIKDYRQMVKNSLESHWGFITTT
jgi:hypothetical protein